MSFLEGKTAMKSIKSKTLGVLLCTFLSFLILEFPNSAYADVCMGQREYCAVLLQEPDHRPNNRYCYENQGYPTALECREIIKRHEEALEKQASREQASGKIINKGTSHERPWTYYALGCLAVFVSFITFRIKTKRKLTRTSDSVTPPIESIVSLSNSIFLNFIKFAFKATNFLLLWGFSTFIATEISCKITGIQCSQAGSTAWLLYFCLAALLFLTVYVLWFLCSRRGRKSSQWGIKVFFLNLVLGIILYALVLNN
ncbi:MAG: hypothetical protein NDJ24_01440 [Alphaproteobacteria bacterium]|nr:hypothetical protein [Alphaproteobacteria bacterium]